jgi:hypothetical protein
VPPTAAVGVPTDLGGGGGGKVNSLTHGFGLDTIVSQALVECCVVCVKKGGCVCVCVFGGGVGV